MLDQKTNVPQRFIGLDVHKHYLIALGVDAELRVVLPAQRVEFTRLENWMNKTLTSQDAVVLETPALACWCKCDHQYLATV